MRNILANNLDLQDDARPIGRENARPRRWRQRDQRDSRQDAPSGRSNWEGYGKTISCQRPVTFLEDGNRLTVLPKYHPWKSCFALPPTALGWEGCGRSLWLRSGCANVQMPRA